jgi:transcriptional regulator with XRE-family HTH domain
MGVIREMEPFSASGGIFDSLHHDMDFCIEAAKLDFALELKRVMDQGGIKNVDLAQRLEVSKPMVSKLLRGDTNMTIETMVRAAKAVGGNIFIKVVRNNCTPKLFEIVKAEQHRSPQTKMVKNTYRIAMDGSNINWADFFDKANGNEEKSIAA